MHEPNLHAGSENQNKELILKQLDRILESPLFSVSKVLSNFLKFIVVETLAGRSDCIKEYSIATCVLNKPAHFNQNNDGIVRIHAGRLRTALESYYCNSSSDNHYLIKIPKGRYIPVFEELVVRQENPDDEKCKKLCLSMNNTIRKRIAFAPFKSFEKAISKKTLVSMIDHSLSYEFGKFHEFSIFSYSTIRHINHCDNKIGYLSRFYEVDYLLTGTVQFQSNMLKVFVHLIDASKDAMIWSEPYNFEFDENYVFKLGDKIVQNIISGLKVYFQEIYSNKEMMPMEKMNERADKKISYMKKII
jgi:TolB-like protein